MKPDIARLLEMLQAHNPADEAEKTSVARVADLLRRASEPCSRATLEGHVTASAMVLDGQGRSLLLFHAKLGIWVQPGGHLEATDASPAAAALREAREETGLQDLVMDASFPGAPLLDVDVHPIPENAKRQEPAHWHHDLCFLVRTSGADATRIDPEESHDFRWIARSELETLPIDGATRRRLLKAFAVA